MARYLQEHLTFSQAQVELLSEDAQDGSGKTLYMQGICIEGDKRNANERIYPAHEIRKAVGTINEQLKSGNSVLGEVDHPDDLKINLDRVSHMIAQPSAPNAYPTAIYEGLMNMKYGHRLLEVAREAGADNKVQRYLKSEVVKLIKDLKIREE